MPTSFLSTCWASTCCLCSGSALLIFSCPWLRAVSAVPCPRPAASHLLFPRRQMDTLISSLQVAAICGNELHSQCWPQDLTLFVFVWWPKAGSRAQDNFLSATSVLLRHCECAYTYSLHILMERGWLLCLPTLLLPQSSENNNKHLLHIQHGLGTVLNCLHVVSHSICTKSYEVCTSIFLILHIRSPRH